MKTNHSIVIMALLLCGCVSEPAHYWVDMQANRVLSTEEAEKAKQACQYDEKMGEAGELSGKAIVIYVKEDHFETNKTDDLLKRSSKLIFEAQSCMQNKNLTFVKTKP